MKIVPRETVVFNLLSRADRLFEDGYHVSEIVGDLYCMTAKNGAQYEVDRREWTCSCPAFKSRKYRDSKDRCTCKHLIGARKLMDTQAAIERAFSRVDYIEGRTNILQGVTK